MEESDIPFYNAISKFQNEHYGLNYVLIGTNSNPSPINNTEWLTRITESDRVYGTEPFSPAYQKCLTFLSEYPNIKSKLLNFAIAEKNGVARLYQGLMDWKSNNKTGIHGSLIEPKNSTGEYDYSMYVDVSAITFEYFAYLLDIQKIDILIVDVEGFEMEVVKQCLSLGFRPKMIYYEEFNMKQEQKDSCYSFLSPMYDITRCKFDNLCLLRE